MFGGSPDSTGFLDIQWADIVYILVLRGSVRLVGNTVIIKPTLVFQLRDCIKLGEDDGRGHSEI